MGKVQSLINEQKTDLKRLLYNYTMTLIMGALISVVYVINDMAELAGHKVMQHFYVVSFAFAIGCFFIETFYVNKNEPKKIGFLTVLYVVSFIIAVVVDLLIEKAEKLTDKQAYYISIYIIAVYVTLVCIALYKLVKRNGIEIEKYFARVLFGLLKIWGLVFLLYLAFILILEIFNSLISDIDYWESLFRIEILLAGFLYFPYSILTISDTSDDNSKFTKGLLMYALMPCALIATGIIYMYIIKIIASGELPSNQVFRICAELFLLGGPVWLMSGAFLREKADKNGVALGIYGKVVDNMAYIYIPCIILEIICIGIRIVNYGLTETRYMAIAVIIFQIIYVAWKPLMKLMKKDEGYEGLILVFLGMFLIATIAPFVNYQKASFLSQKARFEKAMAAGDMVTAMSTYEYLECNIYGDQYLYDEYSKEERVELEISFSEYMDEYDVSGAVYNDTIYCSANNGNILTEGLSVEGYSTMYRTNFYSGSEYMEEDDIKNIQLKYHYDEYVTVDLTECIEYYTSCYEENEVGGTYVIAINDSMDLIIYEISFRREENRMRMSYIDMSGYILVK